jgi:NitT/TauT family transport system substrate-binding protein
MPGFATVFPLRNAETTALGKPLRAFPFADNGLKVYGECEFAAEKTIAQSPDLLARYVKATQRALRWSRDNPEATAAILAKAHPELNEAQVLVNHKAYMGYVFNDDSARVGLGGFDPEQLKRTFEAVKTAQKLDATPDPASFVDTRFLPKE